jgi:hypothetical protein
MWFAETNSLLKPVKIFWFSEGSEVIDLVLTKDIHQTNASEELKSSLAEWRSMDLEF